jgi:hypothetical protein
MFTDEFMIAQKHKEEGRNGMAFNVLIGALFSAISQAVTETATPSEGVTLLRGLGIETALREFTLMNQSAFSQLNSGVMKFAVCNEPTLICLAWFIGDSDGAKGLLEVTHSEKVLRHFPLTGFWWEFSVGLLCLTDRLHYEFPVLKVKGYEHYLMPYLHLISDMSYGRDKADALSEVERAFKARNQDKRLIDWRSIDGDGKRPVKWDFRRQALLSYDQVA